MRRVASIAAFALFLALAAAPGAGAAERSGEPFFPRAGNPGYEVRSYDVHLTYRPASGFLEARTLVRARAEQGLRRFSFDLAGLTVTEVLVGGEPARFSRGRDKLRIVSPHRIPKDDKFTVTVDYRGHPRKVTDPDGSQEGWYRTPDGALAVGEPLGTMAWIPCNNVPADKARFKVAVTVPRRLKAVSNGVLLGESRKGGWATFVWAEENPMSTYLAVIDIGRGRLEKVDGGPVPAWNLVDPALARDSAGVLHRLPEVIGFLSSIYGPYPFNSAGSIVDDAPELGYALETQSRPIYAFAPDLTTFVHETAHQWFGDSVGLRSWPQIWLNESFATWSEWYYAERHGGRTAKQIFGRLYRNNPPSAEIWNPPPAALGSPVYLFAPSTYVRGGMALEALRIKIGTRPFLELLRRWATAHRYGDATIAEFEALAEEVSGEKLRPLFKRWLYQRGKP